MYGPEVDVWSLGVIFYILLYVCHCALLLRCSRPLSCCGCCCCVCRCGYPPFYGDTQSELFSSIKSGEFEFDDEDWGGISDTAKDLIKRMLVSTG